MYYGDRSLVLYSPLQNTQAGHYLSNHMHTLHCRASNITVKYGII